MAHSYTPGLRMTPYTSVQRRRILPLKGEVTVSVGDAVSREDVVASTELPGDVASVNVMNLLGIDAAQVSQYMLKAEGETVARDEPIAETRPFIKWFRSSVKSPIDGVVESMSSVTGQVLLRHPPRPVDVTAYVDGTVVEVIPHEGVVVETNAAFIQGIFGIGGEAHGPVRMLVTDPDEEVSADAITAEHEGCVLVCGSFISEDVVRAAARVKAAGVIAGGISADGLKNLLGYDLGVAITGTETIGTTVIVTEGFGRIAMARGTFDILVACCAEQTLVASINGATQIRAGVQRPEIIVPRDPPESDAAQSVGSLGLETGDPVRIIREPYFGKLGAVASLPSDLQVVESETRVRVLEVEFEDGERAVVPRANVESITQ